MGSLALESRTPLVVKIRLPRDVRSFSDLASVTAALRYIDNFELDNFARPNPQDLRFRRGGRAKLISFTTSSPPDFSILADPAWLSLFITVIANFDGIERNVGRARDRAGVVIDQIRGITADKRQELRIGVNLLLDRAFEVGADAAQGVADRLRQQRSALLTPNVEGDIEIDVTDTEEWGGE